MVDEAILNGRVEYQDGTQIWYLNGKRHREDGPAYLKTDGSRAWYIDGYPLFIFDSRSNQVIFVNGKS